MNEQMQLTDFLQAAKNPHKLKGYLGFLGWYGLKWVQSVWSRDSKFDCL